MLRQGGDDPAVECVEENRSAGTAAQDGGQHDLTATGTGRGKGRTGGGAVQAGDGEAPLIVREAA